MEHANSFLQSILHLSQTIILCYDAFERNDITAAHQKLEMFFN